MTNEEKAKEIAEYINKPNGSNCLVQCHQAAMAMANYKERQFENKIRRLLNTSFYINSYNENIVCSDCFEFDGSFTDFVESFIKKLNEIDV